jgi:outer membrane protein TolC
VQEQRALKTVADSSKGLSLNINISGQSIHEDRPNQSFYQRYRSFASLYARKPIYHWGALESASNIAEEKTRLSELSYNENISGITSQSRSIYLDLLVLQKKIELHNNHVNRKEESLASTSKQQQLGLKTKLEVNESNASYLENKIILANLQQQLSNLLYSFQSLTGWENNLTFSDNNGSFETLVFLHDFEEDIPPQITGMSSMLMKRIKHEMEIEKNNLTIAKSMLKPKLNLVGGIYQDQVALADSESSLLRNNMVVGLEASWNIWDSSKSSGEKMATLARKRRLDYALDRELKAFRLHLINLRTNLKALAHKIDINRALFQVANTRFETSKIELAANRISQNKHLESKIALDTAKINQLESVCQYLKTHDLYMKAINTK